MNEIKIKYRIRKHLVENEAKLSVDADESGWVETDYDTKEEFEEALEDVSFSYSVMCHVDDYRTYKITETIEEF